MLFTAPSRCHLGRRRGLLSRRYGPADGRSGAHSAAHPLSRRLVSRGGDDLHYADYLEYVIEKEGGIGAFIAEPIRNTDVQVPSKAYWQRVREICDRHKVLLIVDEIPNALGRTGHWFSFEEFGIEPDIICLGKGLGAVWCRLQRSSPTTVSIRRRPSRSVTTPTRRAPSAARRLSPL